MSITPRGPFRRRAALAALTATATLTLGGVATAQFTVNAVNGDDAVAALGQRLADVARDFRVTEAEMADIFRTDHTLWLLDDGQLAYIDTAIPEVEHQPRDEPVALNGIPLDQAFLLESDPGADRTIYLDFDGHHSVSNAWNHNIVFPPYNVSGNDNSFTDGELAEIISIWEHVVDDFAPWTVNVTTKDPGIAALTRTNGGDLTYGSRCIMTQPTNGFGNGIGGVAIPGSFNDSVDNPVFAFNKGPNNGSMTASHEVGHALGLSHDGLFALEYHPGSGAGSTSWGPIMGAPFDQVLVQWSNGDYDGSSTTQNDVTIIGFMCPVRADDHADTIATATPFTECSSTLTGILGNRNDVDVFSFDVPADGSVTMVAAPTLPGPNVDVQLTLIDGAGVPMFSFSPPSIIDAPLIGFPMTAGQYYIEIDGVGLANEYSDYGSIGQFTLLVEVPCGSCLGDITGDGTVGIQDFLDLLAAWGPNPGHPADFNGDGVVGIQDFLDLLGAWGPCP